MQDFFSDYEVFDVILLYLVCSKYTHVIYFLVILTLRFFFWPRNAIRANLTEISHLSFLSQLYSCIFSDVQSFLSSVPTPLPLLQFRGEISDMERDEIKIHEIKRLFKKIIKSLKQLSKDYWFCIVCIIWAFCSWKRSLRRCCVAMLLLKQRCTHPDSRPVNALDEKSSTHELKQLSTRLEKNYFFTTFALA